MEWWVEGQNLYHWEYKESIFYLQVNIHNACIIFWHFKMGNSWYPESFFNEFSGTETLLCLKAFSFLDSQGTKTLSRLPGFNNMMSPALIKEQVLCWWRNGSGQFLRKEVSALPSLPLHSSSIIYPGLHHPLLRCLCEVLALGMFTGAPFISPPRK